jgi:HAD superfamily hydrolase (TIGR01509 family)
MFHQSPGSFQTRSGNGRLWIELARPFSYLFKRDMDKTLKAVVFDFDGTLTRPGSLDFSAIRQAVGGPAGQPILEFIATLPDGEPRNKANRILERFEREAAEKSMPNAGAENLVILLKNLQLKLGILTRNSLHSINFALRNFRNIGKSDFGAIITRHDPAQPKPHPDGVLLTAKKLGVPPDSMLIVGDYVFDVEAGRRAGARTAFLVSESTTHFPDPPADFTIKALDELKAIVRPLILERAF